KQQTSVVERVVQRLLAKAITRQQQALAAFIPYSECKHSAEGMHAIRAMVLIKVHDHFGIGVGIKAMASRLQPCSELGKVVYFTVEYGPDGPVLVVNRLPAGGEIDYAEPPHAQSDLAGDVNALIVGPTVRDRAAHPAYLSSVGAEAPVTAHNACDS